MRFVVLMLALTAGAAAQSPTPVVPNRAPLAKTPYTMLPLGSVKPSGWLGRQLRIQADGLSGHLPEFWPDLGVNSAWLGGTGEAWERGPYYLDGLIPLAVQLNDAKLMALSKKWVDAILSAQREDGRLGPFGKEDWWPNFVLFKALIQWQEATGDPRVIPAMQRYFTFMGVNLDRVKLKEWATVRWPEQALSILWLYNRTGDPGLLALLPKLQSQGHDWLGFFANDYPFTAPATKQQTNLLAHGVNNAMALKTGAIQYQYTKQKQDLAKMFQQWSLLEQHHRQPNYTHSGDEHLAGLSPSRGTELCTVVEAMFSYEHMFAVTGDIGFAERLERLAYNPLPGTFDKAMWAHQYDQQANQALVSRAKRDWISNGPDSNLFGLEPNFGCCTANMHQGWPKFVANLWMASDDGGVLALAYGPNELATTIGDVRVRIAEETEYPFRGKIKFTIRPDKPVEFPLHLRIPFWTADRRGTAVVAGTKLMDLEPGRFLRLSRTWTAGDVVELDFPMLPRAVSSFQSSLVVERGPLVFSLKIGEQWSVVKEHPRAPDYEVKPTTPWNYALAIRPEDFASRLEVEERPVGQYPFSHEGAPVIIRAKARRLPSWTMQNDSAAPPPRSPVETAEPEETVTLIPYGAARLRITAFPHMR
jgi:hypothetical protein